MDGGAKALSDALCLAVVSHEPGLMTLLSRRRRSRQLDRLGSRE